MKVNKRLLLAVIVLNLFGLMMIYSSSYIWAEYKFDNPYKFIINQSIFSVVGFLLMLFVSKINHKIFEKKCNLIFFSCLILLVLVLIPGIGTVRNGSQSWFGIGSFGIQPSEFMKLAFLIFVSKYLKNNERNMNSFKNGIFPILLLVLGVFFLIMLQPDFGTGSIIVMSVMVVLLIGGANFNFFIKMACVGIIGVVGLIVAAPYRIARILSFLDPWKDPLGSGFQIIQSLYAIGPGGVLGFGLGNSRQKHFYLPEPQTDFIFAIISEEFGFMGILIISLLFLTIIIRGFSISKNCNDLFSKYLSFGIIFGFSFQTILNLMVVTGLIPVTGVTLPFISYGGSSLLITLISMGILLNISKNIK